jgi:antitoxin HicB
VEVRNKYSGSTFDSFLQEEGIKPEVETVAIKRVLAWQFKQAMEQQHKSKVSMAKELHTSRSQLDRLLDPNKLSVTLGTISKAAKILGKQVIIQIADSEQQRARHKDVRHRKRIAERR